MLRVTDIDLRLLRIFKSVTDCGGFSAAETTLDMNLSTISTHMSELESRLGLRLCERGRQGFRLTDEGRATYLLVEQLLNSVEDFRAGVGAIHQQIGGALGVGVVDNTLTDPQARISAAILALKQRGGDLHVRLEIKSPSEIEQAVQERRLHVGIVPSYNELPGLRYEPLYTETLTLYCGSGHPLFDAAPDGVELTQLDGLDFVSRGYMRENRELSSTARLNASATVHHMEAVATLILSGAFVGYLPQHYAAQWVASQRMRPVRPDLLSQQAAFSIVTRRDRGQTIAVQAFVDALRGNTANARPAGA